jgi:ABC-type transport system involved in Fe-S cluster assembly fused permease/ATPase subunit
MTAVNEVTQYVHMLMNILPASMEIFVAVMVTIRQQNANHDKITIVVIPTTVLVVLSVPQLYLQTSFQCCIIVK